jgi:hypothetical protein
MEELNSNHTLNQMLSANKFSPQIYLFDWEIPQLFADGYCFLWNNVCLTLEVKYFYKFASIHVFEE